MEKIKLPKKVYASSLVNAKQLDSQLEESAKKLGFESHKEKLKYLFAHKSGWYYQNPNKSIFDSEFLVKYFENKEEYIQNIETIPSILLWLKTNEG